MALSIDALGSTASRAEGVSAEQEAAFLQECLVFIRDLATYLRLSQACVATAQHFFHKFDRDLMAGVCLFFAAKLCEEVRHLNEFSTAFYDLSSRKRQLKLPRLKVPELNEARRASLRERACCYEFLLLSEVGFDFTRNLPYATINVYKAQLEPQVRNAFTRVCYNFASDSFRTQVCLVRNGEEIGNTCIYLACKFLNLPTEVQPDPYTLDQLLSVYEHFLN